MRPALGVWVRFYYDLFTEACISEVPAERKIVLLMSLSLECSLFFFLFLFSPFSRFVEKKKSWKQNIREESKVAIWRAISRSVFRPPGEDIFECCALLVSSCDWPAALMSSLLTCGVVWKKSKKGEGGNTQKK